LKSTFGRGDVAPDEIRPQDIMAFIAKKSAAFTRGTAKVISTALQSYLRYLQLEGRLSDVRLLSAIPSIPLWRLANIPKALGADDLRLFLKSFDQTTTTGRRDYAMALFLTECGLRVSEIPDLKLTDVNWRELCFQVPKSKTHRARLLPLTPRLGRALAAYLRDGRPKSTVRTLFLRHRAPCGQVTVNIVRGVMRRTYEKSGGAPWSGPHALRHTVAARLMTGGTRIKDVADILGHSSIDTTTIYTKVDLPTLRNVSMPWPGRTRP
jgi:integrase